MNSSIFEDYEFNMELFYKSEDHTIYRQDRGLSKVMVTIKNGCESEIFDIKQKVKCTYINGELKGNKATKKQIKNVKNWLINKQLNEVLQDEKSI